MAVVRPDRNAELRKALRPYRTKADLFAAGLFTADVAMYVLFTALAVGHPSLLVRFAAGLPAGVLLAVLFVVGHDACHGSYTSRRWLNQLIGRLAFLPTLTPYSTWELSHNLTHHVYTNLRPLDYLWAPLTKREYDALPAWRRKLERVYRHPLGLALYYPVEIWWKRLLFPARRFVQPSRGIYVADSALCSGVFLVALDFAARHGFWAVLSGILWPFAIWSWLMSWALLAQHTHPDVPWFDDEREWREAQSRTVMTVHVVAPGPLNFMLHRIMEHTAHHLDVTVPLYHLAAAQAELESRSGELVVERWTPRSFLEHLRSCKLYDYDRRLWLDFDGQPTRR
jgi:acyl-lipid omega-6 desaturase (Delta-12 desaturase)